MQPEPRLAASMAGALDLSALKARATAPPPAVPPNGAAAPSKSSSPYVIDVTEASFQTDVIDRSMQVPVVLDLWAAWCEPCKQLSPILEKLAVEGNGAWILAKLDVDANQRIAQALKVQGIPAVKAVLQGQLVAEFSGAIPEAEARQFVAALVEAAGGALPAGAVGADDTAVPEPEDPRIVAAEEAVERGDFEAAAAAYQAILDSEPAHPYAADALLQARFMQRLEATSPDTVALADSTPDDVAAQCAAADVLVAQGRVEDAFGRLVELVRRTTGADRDTSREHLVGLFAVVGDDPRVGAARRALTNALF
ncbi:MAG: tetratricopeptide repeat protein [Actinomycetota bacterium]|nr:tetratricopeptide repeat protein [Actinomycetota bacterium]